MQCFFFLHPNRLASCAYTFQPPFKGQTLTVICKARNSEEQAPVTRTRVSRTTFDLTFVWVFFPHKHMEKNTYRCVVEADASYCSWIHNTWPLRRHAQEHNTKRNLAVVASFVYRKMASRDCASFLYTFASSIRTRTSDHFAFAGLGIQRHWGRFRVLPNARESPASIRTTYMFLVLAKFSEDCCVAS